MGFGHNIAHWHARDVYGFHDNIAAAAARALGQTGVGDRGPRHRPVLQPLHHLHLMQLEHYGFCKPGHAGGFVADGGISLEGSIPANTGGGQISGFYVAGFTPIIEAVKPLRGEAGPTQVQGARLAFTSGDGLNGGVQNTWSHGTLILRAHLGSLGLC